MSDKADLVDGGIERIRPDGKTERIISFSNGRRARVVNLSEGYTVQLLDCRNDEHENRLFKMRDGMGRKAANAALVTISKLPAPTPHKYDR